MTIREWQSLGPVAAAREVHRRIRRLTPAHQRAVFALLPDEAALAKTLAAAEPGAPLAGVPYFLKDLFDLAGQLTFAGSTFLPEVRPAPVVDAAIAQALRDAGAACAGKTHLHEFAYGITGENPHYGDCEHPRFPGRTTGGSSSGSAAVVAAGIVPLAIGTDTGGSVRLPAAFCGLFGFRLTPRDRFIADAVPLAPSFDTAGWFTDNAPDMKIVISALVGMKTAASTPRGHYLEMPGLDADVSSACRHAAERLAPATDSTTDSQLTAAFSRAAATYHAIVASEARHIHRGWVDKYRDRYDPAVWARLNRAQALESGQIAAARASVTAIRETWRTFFLSYDFLVLPAAPFGALTKPECTLENRNRIIALTAPASIGGLPVLTVPVRLSSGLTTGLQIVTSQVGSPVVPWTLDKHEC